MAPSPVHLTVQGILFDMDGVLISSIASANRCWRQWAAEHDVPGAATLEIPHGTPARSIMLELKPGWQNAPDREQRLADGLRRIEDLEVTDTADLTVLPGVRVLLAQLPFERWAIVTSATRRLLLGRLAAARLPVPDRLITFDLVTHGKPHPEPYQKGAALLGLSPGDCLVVEDAPNGIRSGIAAGCQVLGVAGTHTPAELLAAGAHWVANGLAAVTATPGPHGIGLDFDPL